MEARKREAGAATGKVTRRDPARTKSSVIFLSPLVAFLSAAFGLDPKRRNSERKGDA